MVAAASLSTLGAGRPRAEQSIVFDGIPWKTYVLLREAIDEPRFRMTYCDGALEIMSPSKDHEMRKSGVARLLELYAFIARIPLASFGSTTFRREARARGLEPDASWSVGRGAKDAQTPHIALEVLETRPLVDKLVVYDGLEVAEVWLLERGKLSIHRRKAKGGYVKARRSGFFPKLDPKLIERYVDRAADDDAIHEFAALARGRKR